VVELGSAAEGDEELVSLGFGDKVLVSLGFGLVAGSVGSALEKVVLFGIGVVSGVEVVEAKFGVREVAEGFGAFRELGSESLPLGELLIVSAAEGEGELL
jgi:hypothetical protein